MKYKQVSNMPFMFPQYAKNLKFRKAVIAYGYIVFYQVDKKDKTIKVYHVLHGKQNIEGLI